MSKLTLNLLMSILAAVFLGVSLIAMADEVPEPGGAFFSSPLRLLGPKPIYDPSDPPEPGGAFRGASEGSRAGRDDGSNSGSSKTEKSKKSDGADKTAAAAEKTAAAAFRSNFAMLNNYAGIGKGREAAEYARRILDEGGESLTAQNLWACGDALRPCVGDYDADLMRAELFKLIVSRFPDSREATLAKLELGE